MTRRRGHVWPCGVDGCLFSRRLAGEQMDWTRLAEAQLPQRVTTGRISGRIGRIRTGSHDGI